MDFNHLLKQDQKEFKQFLKDAKKSGKVLRQTMYFIIEPLLVFLISCFIYSVLPPSRQFAFLYAILVILTMASGFLFAKRLIEYLQTYIILHKDFMVVYTRGKISIIDYDQVKNIMINLYEKYPLLTFGDVGVHTNNDNVVVARWIRHPRTIRVYLHAYEATEKLKQMAHTLQQPKEYNILNTVKEENNNASKN